MQQGDSQSRHSLNQSAELLRDRHSIKELFIRKALPKFSITSLKAQQEAMNSLKYSQLVSVLDRWNKCIEANRQSLNVKAEFCRNQFIYSTLTNLSKAKQECKDPILNRLYAWYLKNSNPETNISVAIGRKLKKDDAWLVRETYRSNMPLEIDSYNRKVLQMISVPAEIHSTLNKTSSYFDFGLKSEERSMRNKREQLEVEAQCASWKASRSRFNEENFKNCYTGTFDYNSPWMTTTASPRKYDDHLKQLKASCAENLLRKGTSRLSDIFSATVSVFGIDGVNLIPNPNEKKNKPKKKQK